LDAIIFCSNSKLQGVVSKKIKKLNKLTEKHIELFIKDSSQFSIEERKWIERSIESNEELKILANWFKRFYEIKEISKTIQPTIFKKPDTITLSPMKMALKPKNSFILAAQSISASKKEQLKTVKTFISTQHKTLMRILQNEIRNETEVHFLSDFISDDDIVLLYITGENSYLVSDEGGFITIPRNKISKEEIIDWKQCKIHLPAFKLFVKKISSSEFKIESEQSFLESDDVSIEKIGNQYEVNLRFIESWIDPKMIVLKSDKLKSLWFLNNGKAIIDEKYFTDTNFTIHLYN